MNRTPVISSQIAAIGWDEATKTMEVEFKGGSVYQYTGPNVEQHYKAMLKAHEERTWVGSYFTRIVKKDPTTQYKKIS